MFLYDETKNEDKPKTNRSLKSILNVITLALITSCINTTKNNCPV